MKRRRWILVVVLVLALGAGIGYTAYVGYEGSRQMVSVDELRSRDCRTPDVLFGWEYEAINYDIADDAALKAANPDMSDCDSQGTKAGTEVVTPTACGSPAGTCRPPTASVPPARRWF